ncbi:hypothetical protein [Fodinicurvata halophila]|uniref:hypothetical protein n=1 Tax=Fodinicurvata halophila TaxID=1419723 RepID=UPI0036250CA4
MAGVAARTAVTDFLGLQQDDVAPRAGQVDGGGQAGIATADDTDLGLDVAFQGLGGWGRGSSGMPQGVAEGVFFIGASPCLSVAQ